MAMYYDQGTALTGAYVLYKFDVPLYILDIINDGGTNLSWSYDGTTEAGRLKPGESKPVTMNGAASIYIKGTAGQAYRLNAEAKVGQ